MILCFCLCIASCYCFFFKNITPDFLYLWSPNFLHLTTPNFLHLPTPNFLHLSTPNFPHLSTPNFQHLSTPMFFLERGTLADLFFFCDPQCLVVEHAFGTVALVAEGSVTCGFDLSAVPLLYPWSGCSAPNPNNKKCPMTPLVPQQKPQRFFSFWGQQ